MSYLSVAPAVGIKVEELYRHVLALKGVVEVRQGEDRLARDQPELKETIDQLEQTRARLAHLAFANPTAGQRQLWLQQLDALAAVRKTWKATSPARAARSGGFKRPVGWGQPRWPRLCHWEVSSSTCSITTT